jgi:hypothetical protein
MRVIPACLAVGALLIPARAARAQPQDFSKVEVRATKLAEGVHLLVGAGRRSAGRPRGSARPASPRSS